MNQEFMKSWLEKVRRVRASQFWQQISSAPAAKIERSQRRARKSEAAVDGDWVLALAGVPSKDGAAGIVVGDFRKVMSAAFGLRLPVRATVNDRAAIVFQLVGHGREAPQSKWDSCFDLDVAHDRIVVKSETEVGLLQGGLYLSNYFRMRGDPYIACGRQRIRPAVDAHIGADLWGGFCTTQAWVGGREADENYIELARVGINGLPVTAMLEDYIADAPREFASLVNPAAAFNRRRLRTLARQTARYGVYVFLVAYNPKPAADHVVFDDSPRSRGARQFGGSFTTLCSSDRKTRRFLSQAWASLFEEIPELGGMATLCGGEGFYHCFMRSEDGAKDCRRCSKRNGSEVVAEFLNSVGEAVHVKSADAKIVVWPYSAGHWSGDRDQVDFIGRLDPEHITFITENDKDGIDWRSRGYAKDCWDYSASFAGVTDRCRRQQKLCKDRAVDFGCKLEMNSSIECLSTPYLPTFQNRMRVWDACRKLKPKVVFSRWMFDGSCGSPSEELGYWTIWGKQSEFGSLDHALACIARRDFDRAAAKHVLRAWQLFSDAMRHHPCLDYYVGPYFIGAGQPLVIDTTGLPDDGRVKAKWLAHELNVSFEQRQLDDVFFGQFYWVWEGDASGDDSHFVNKDPLFYYEPAYRAIARRGSDTGCDVSLDEFRELARLWETGLRELSKAEPLVPRAGTGRFKQEWTIARHLGYTWHSAVNVEEFLRLRNTVFEFSGSYAVRSGHVRENLRDLGRMETIARDELQIAKADLALTKGVEYLDLSLRMDMGTASLEAILRAKIRQVTHLLKIELPRLRKEVQRW